MNVLIACEESQRVCIEFRKMGFNAFSCDLLDCSGGHPEWHIKDDCLPLITTECGFFKGIFETSDGEIHTFRKWDLIIAHPPCTYLTVTGNRWFNIEEYGNDAKLRYKERLDAVRFFMNIVLYANTEHLAIENPIGIMSSYYRKPNQIIHPYMFGDQARKATCLWLKGLPNLIPTDEVEPEIIRYKNGKGTDNPWHMDTMKLPPDERARERSKTFPGIAKAMAQQWGSYLLENERK